MFKITFIFPGQGAQKTGMGKSIYSSSEEAKQIFDRADSILGRSLSSLCFEGSEDELQKTENAQVALFTSSIATFEVLKKNRPEIIPEFFGGLSLGEYSALCAAEVISFEDGLKLVDKRARLMQSACDGSEGGMASIVGLDAEKLDSICASLPGYMIIANRNCPGQLVISGDRALLGQACEESKKAGAKLTVPLKVGGAFHSKHMEKAAALFKEELIKVNICRKNLDKVLSNVTGQFHEQDEDWADLMASQIKMPVLWENCMRQVLSLGSANGSIKFYELGCGKTLCGMMKRIDKQALCFNLDTFDQLKDI